MNAARGASRGYVLSVLTAGLLAGCGGAASVTSVARPDGSGDVGAVVGGEEALALVEVKELPPEGAEPGRETTKGDATEGDLDLDEDVKRPQNERLPHAPPPVQAATTSTGIAGQVDPNQIRAAVARDMARFAPCLPVDTVVEIDATLSAAGEVSNVKATRSQPDNAKIRDCVADAFARIHVEPLSPPAPAHVRLSLSLRKPQRY